MHAREQALREQAFIDWNSVVLGESLRQITLGDMLLLQGAGSPFIAGGAYPEASDVLQFLWILHAENRGNRLRRHWERSKMINRVAQITAKDPLDVCCKAIDAYLDDAFQDAPRGGKNDGRPLGVCFMASILVRVGSAMGACDPATGKRWSDVPMARIFQYMKALNRAELGKDFKDFSPSDKVMSDWLDHNNRVAAEAAKGE
jgi:hypothetical protein